MYAVSDVIDNSALAKLTLFRILRDGQVICSAGLIASLAHPGLGGRQFSNFKFMTNIGIQYK
jgi:hypothetical protein